jgi:hypothetical protein
MVFAQDTAPPPQSVLMQVTRGIYLTQHAQVNSEVTGAAQGARIIFAERAALAFECVLVQVTRGPRLAEHAQDERQVVGRDQGVVVVFAQDTAPPGQSGLVQVAGFGVTAHLQQCPRVVVRGHERVLVILAEAVTPLLVETAHQVSWCAGVTALDQVPARTAGELAKVSAVGAGQVSGQHVGQQPRPLGPGFGIGRVAGVAGRQDRLGARARGGRAGRGQLVAQDGLGEPVHLQPAAIDAGQRLPRYVQQGLPPCQRIGGLGCQLAWQQAGSAGEQVVGYRLGGQECAEAGQLGSGGVLFG